jgi:hypothetical protein
MARPAAKQKLITGLLAGSQGSDRIRTEAKGLPEDGEDGRVGEPSWITLAFVDVADNVQGEPPPHARTVSELNGNKIARAIEGVGHEA